MALLDPRWSHVLLSPTKLSSIDMHSGRRSGPSPVHLDAHQVVQIEHVAGHHLARSNLQLFGSAEWLGRLGRAPHTVRTPSRIPRTPCDHLRKRRARRCSPSWPTTLCVVLHRARASTPSLIMQHRAKIWSILLTDQMNLTVSVYKRIVSSTCQSHLCASQSPSHDQIL